VQAIRADDQVEVTDLSTVEGHADAIAVVRDCANAVAENRLDVIAERAVDDGGQLASGDADVAATGPANEQLGIESGDAPAILGDLPDLGEAISRRMTSGAMPIASATSKPAPQKSTR
jgi:hypothetical protein